MSSSPEQVLQAGTSSIASSPPPPIVELLQLAYTLVLSSLAFLWTATTYLFSALRTASLPLTALLSVLYTPISYVVAPFILSVTILVGALVATPFTILRGILADFYPIYSFLVVSCVYAALIGLCARGITYFGKNAIRYQDDNALNTTTSTTKAQVTHPKKVVIKEEHS
ncbi:hypothetical protein BDW22DRAFT_1352209 [Trametopsis cervina]|nr:hypothetical protein BDW22DRAFT_1352209 [Trametopsis cervina]